MFKHILVPLDGSPLAECALPHSLSVARAVGAKVTILQVVEQAVAGGRTHSIDPLEWEISKAEAAGYVASVGDRLRSAGLEPAAVVLDGHPASQAIAYARDEVADLIALSTHGRSGLSGWNTSSVVQKILMRSRTSILLVPAYQPLAVDPLDFHYRRLLAPLDGSKRAECVIPVATALAAQHDSELVLAHAVRSPELSCRAPVSRGDQDLADRLTERNRVEAARYLAELQAQLSVPAQTRLIVSDRVSATLHQLMADESVDLVILSAHGYSGDARWRYGSVTASFIDYGHRPLLIVQDMARHEIAPTAAELAVEQHWGH
jgi:nucleotide-binding universal stress UspA family protein